MNHFSRRIRNALMVARFRFARLGLRAGCNSDTRGDHAAE